MYSEIHDPRLCLGVYCICIPILMLIVIVSYSIDDTRAGFVVYCTYAALMAAGAFIAAVSLCVAMRDNTEDQPVEVPVVDPPVNTSQIYMQDGSYYASI